MGVGTMQIKKITNFLYLLILVAGTVSAGCSGKKNTVAEIKHYPVDGLGGVISKSAVIFDKEISSDGNGSIRITSNKPCKILLYETGDVDADNARLTYRAKVRTQDVHGTVYLEMLCQFPDGGEYFSKDLGSPLTGTNEWSTEETHFILKRGENPDNVKLNIIVDGTGTVDDIRLIKGPVE